MLIRQTMQGKTIELDHRKHKIKITIKIVKKSWSEEWNQQGTYEAGGKVECQEEEEERENS